MFQTFRHQTRLTQIALLVALAAIALCLRQIIITYHPLPWQDEWDTVALIQKLLASPRDTLPILFAQHNEHRIMIPRLIYLADFFAGRGKMIITLAASVILQLCLLTAFARYMHKQLALPTHATILLSALCACLLFSGQQMTNFVWGFDVQWFCVALFAALALMQLGTALTAQKPARATLYACLSAFAATYSMANGVAIWPLMFVLIFWAGSRPYDKRIITAVTASATISLFIYFRDFTFYGEHKPIYIIAAIKFTVAALGGPFAFLWDGAAYVFGAAIIAASLPPVWLLLRHRRLLAVSESALSLLALFFLGGAALMGLGRSSMGNYALATESHYATPMLVLPCVLLTIYASLHNRQVVQTLWPRLMAKLPTLPVAGPLGALALLAYTLASHIWLPYDYTQLPILKQEAALALLTNTDDTDAIKITTHDPARAHKLTSFLLAYDASYTDDWRLNLQGRKLDDIFKTNDQICRGHTDGIAATFGSNAKIYGWGWLDAANRLESRAPGDNIVLTDDKNVIVGFGLGPIPRQDVADALHAPAMATSGWRAYTNTAGGTIHAWLIDRRHGQACRLSGEVIVK